MFAKERRMKSQVKENILPNMPLTSLHLLVIIFLMLFVMTSVVIIEKRLPVGLKIDDIKNNPDTFIAERAMNYLKQLTDIGPRVCGSYENEVLAVNFLISAIKKIKQEAEPHHVIEFDVQKSSGAFPLTFLDGMTNVYRNVQSVIVKIGSQLKSKHALLLNCHFDTVPDSPGASDDGAGCAVMMEILNVITHSKKILKHNIIFLFNGAEENIMQASHGFITQHKWASQVRAFINLEACGAGGREVLFQAGPNSPWIIEEYSDSVPYPYASSLAQEIFESGLIPGETDFRIFRDFGQISGLDFAWSSNGYVYHTEFDNIHQIPLGTLQRTGDNMLALSLGMASGHHLSEISTREGQPVFFDFLGAFVVHFHIGVAALVVLVVVVLSCTHIYLNMAEARRKASISKRAYLQQIVRATIVLLTACSAAIIGCCAVGALLTVLSRAMAWYARPLWLLPLYGAQAIATPMAGVLFASRRERMNPLLRNWLLVQIYADAQALQWSALLLLCVVFRIRSGFVPLVWVLCPAIAGLVRHALLRNCKDWRRLLMYVLGVGIPFVQTFYASIGVIYILIPVLGRAGGSLHSEIVAALIVCSVFLLVTSCSAPLALGTSAPWKLLKFLFGVVLVSIALIVLTPLGFPYSGDPAAPAPQRFMLMHTARRFHASDGAVVRSDSGYWIPDLDTHSPHSVDGYVSEMKDAQIISEPECSAHIYCAMPYYLPVRSLIPRTHWLPSRRPPPRPLPVTFEVVRREKVSDQVERFHLNVTGPNHLGIMLSPVAGATIAQHSFTPEYPPVEGPSWNGRSSFFLFVSDASPITKPWLFHVDVHHSFTNPPAKWLDVSIAGHTLYGEYKVDSEMASLVRKFPPWTTISAWTASLDLYTV